MEETLGKRIVQNRKRMGLTQDQLAEKLGVTAQAVSKWENDQSCPDISTLPRLASLFGITTDELLGVAKTAEPIPAEPVGDELEKGLHAQIGNYNFHLDGGRKSAVGFALFVLVSGVLTLLANILNLDTTLWDILWPTALLTFGVFGLWPGFSFFRFGCMLFGGYFLLSNLRVLPVSLDIGIVMPVLVILIGLSLLADAVKKPRRPKFHFESSDSKFQQTLSTADGYLEYSASFGEANHCIETDVLKGGEIHTSFGDYTISLADVVSVQANCSLELHCSFGELVLQVPRRFAVRPVTSTSFASVEIEGEHDHIPEAIIHAEAHAAFGEVKIQYI